MPVPEPIRAFDRFVMAIGDRLQAYGAVFGIPTVIAAAAGFVLPQLKFFQDHGWGWPEAVIGSLLLAMALVALLSLAAIAWRSLHPLPRRTVPAPREKVGAATRPLVPAAKAEDHSAPTGVARPDLQIEALLEEKKEHIAEALRASHAVPIPAAAKSNPPPTVSAMLAMRAQPPSPDVLRRWAGASSYELWQAAALWGGEAPPLNQYSLTELSRANLATLQAAANDLLLPVTSVGPLGLAWTGPTRPDAIATRAHLTSLADARGERPDFLFPTPQGQSQPIPAPVPKPAGPEPVVGLCIENEHFSYHVESGTNALNKGTCSIDIRNNSQIELMHCRCMIMSLKRSDGTELLRRDTPLYFRAEHTLRRGAMFRVNFLSRDYSDIKTFPPWLLHSEEGTIPLEEETDLALEVTLASDARYPTEATIDLHLAEEKGSTIKVRHQRLARR